MKDNAIIFFRSFADEHETPMPISVIWIDFNSCLKSFSGFVILFQCSENVSEFPPGNRPSRHQVDRLFDSVPRHLPTLEPLRGESETPPALNIFWRFSG